MNLERMRKSGKMFLELSAGRGIPVDYSGCVPLPFCERLLATVRDRVMEKDLILYGVVKLPSTVNARIRNEDGIFQ